MLNSRYAPIIALTVLGVIIVAVLGWFLAISPQLSEASDIRAQAAEVDRNIETINANTAQLDALQAALDEAPDFSEAIALNAPSVYDLPAVRARFSAAISDSGVEVSQISKSASTEIEGLSAASAQLPSTMVAQLFAQGPVQPATTDEAFTPVVTPAAVEGPVAQNLYGVPFSMSIAGTPQEILDFLTELTDPAQPIFQLAAYTIAEREEGNDITGVSAGAEGDATIETSGFLYMLNPDPTLVDEESLTTATLGSESPFLGIESAPEQPGAS